MTKEASRSGKVLGVSEDMIDADRSRPKSLSPCWVRCNVAGLCQVGVLAERTILKAASL